MWSKIQLQTHCSPWETTLFRIHWTCFQAWAQLLCMVYTKLHKNLHKPKYPEICFKKSIEILFAGQSRPNLSILTRPQRIQKHCYMVWIKLAPVACPRISDKNCINLFDCIFVIIPWSYQFQHFELFFLFFAPFWTDPTSVTDQLLYSRHKPYVLRCIILRQ